VKQGWLTKKGGQRRNWKTRWCVLKTNEFSYYTNKKVRLDPFISFYYLLFYLPIDILKNDVDYAAQDAKPKGTIVLSGITVKPSSHKEFCFGISTTERTYLMAGKVPLRPLCSSVTQKRVFLRTRRSSLINLLPFLCCA
jgi:hypothetical protein